MKVVRFDDFLNLQFNFIPGGKFEHKSYILLVIFILMFPSKGSSMMVRPFTELLTSSLEDRDDVKDDELSEFYCKLSNLNPSFNYSLSF